MLSERLAGFREWNRRMDQEDLEFRTDRSRKEAEAALAPRVKRRRDLRKAMRLSKYRAGLSEILRLLGTFSLGLGAAFTAQKHYVAGPVLLALAAIGLVLAIRLNK